MKYKYLSLIAFTGLTLLSCSKLDEKLNGTLNADQTRDILGDPNTAGM